MRIRTFADYMPARTRAGTSVGPLQVCMGDECGCGTVTSVGPAWVTCVGSRVLHVESTAIDVNSKTCNKQTSIEK
jgi:hypothetical protein